MFLDSGGLRQPPLEDPDSLLDDGPARVDVVDPAERRAQTLAVLAQLDGLLLLLSVMGPEAADAAARALGILGAGRSAELP